MGTLFIISSSPGFGTVLQLARRIKGRGDGVILVFRGEGVGLLEQPHFEEEVSFADGVYIFEGEERWREIRTRDVKTISPDELVALMETYKRIVSWV